MEQNPFQTVPIYCYFKAEKLYLKLNDNYNLAKTRFSKANLQYNENDYFNSEIAVFKALQSSKRK